MAFWVRAVLLGFGGLALLLTLVVGIGSWWQRRALANLVAALVRSAGAADRPAVSFDELDELPASVTKYLRLVLRPGEPRIELGSLEQTGRLRTDGTSVRWLPFDAKHVVAPPATGFVWSARVQLGPLLHVRVRDALVAGEGSGHVSLLSAITVASDGATYEVNSGSLHRYLAEAVWYPTALLPSPALRWSDIDETRALATLTDHGVTVSLEFRFNKAGEVAGIFTPARWGSFDGAYKQVPWEGHFRKYEEIGGMLVPSEGEVGWYVDGEWQSVWEGRITDATYELTPSR